jgi:diguanylate cyclase (GGDEF)-like protein
MKNGFLKLQKKGKDSRSTMSHRFSEFVQHLSGIDLSQFNEKIPKAVSKLIGVREVAWLVSEDINGNGIIYSNRKLSKQRTGEMRAKCAELFRMSDFELQDGQTHYWSFVDQGHITYLALYDVNADAQPHLSTLKVLVEALFRSSSCLTEAKALSFIDDVTQLYNQRYLQLVLDKEVRRADRADTPFSVLFIDIDHFKKINDTSGHMVGSKILCHVSDVLKQNIRVIDYGFRYGGDEFILILVGTTSESAAAIGERVRSQIESTVFLVDGKKVHLTLSIGVASFPEHAKTKEEILRLADEAMYESKHKSRNVVSIAG